MSKDETSQKKISLHFSIIFTIDFSVYLYWQLSNQVYTSLLFAIVLHALYGKRVN